MRILETAFLGVIAGTSRISRGCIGAMKLGVPLCMNEYNTVQAITILPITNGHPWTPFLFVNYACPRGLDYISMKKYRSKRLR